MDSIRKINFPEGCDTNEKKYQFTCKAQEEARLLYNIFSKWTSKSITQQDYDKIPVKFKQIFPFTAKLTEENWDNFFNQYYKEINIKISEELGYQRAKAEDDFAKLDITVDLGEI